MSQTPPLEPNEPSVFTEAAPVLDTFSAIPEETPFTFEEPLPSLKKDGNEPSFFEETSQNNETLPSFIEENASPQIKSTSTFEPNAKSLFLTVEELPKSVYVGQIFAIKVKAVIALANFDELTTSFQELPDVEILNPDAKWQWFSDNIFYNTFYLRVTDKLASIPTLTLHVGNGFEVLQEEGLSFQTPDIIQLNGDTSYSGIMAKNLVVQKFKTSRFDDKNLIMVMEIDATYANLGDFKLEKMYKEGIDSSTKDFPNHKIYYFAVFEEFRKTIEFTYFNLEENQFKRINLPVTIDKDDVSTQSGLNPKESQFVLYKNIATALGILVLLFLFISRKKLLYLVLAIALGGYFIYDKNPLSSVKVAGETRVRILPTEKSTIFYVTDRVLFVERLGVRDDYIKVLLPNGKIGWIKEKDVLKN